MKMGIGWVLLMGLCGAAVFDASAEHEYAVLQLHGDPAAAVDASPLGHVLNSMGDVRTVTNHSVFGPGSWYFDGTGDEVRMEDSDVWNFGAEDFTLELWMRSDRANAPGLRERLLGQWETDAAGFTNTANWLAYQAGNTDGIDTRGYRGAAYDGRYFYFAPYSDGTNAHGRVLRYDSQGALNSTSSWAAYDASTTDGMDMRGFNSAVFDGRHVYFIPRVAGGRVLRYDTRSAFKAADSWMGFDVNGVGGLTNQGYVSGLYDGRYLYLTPLEDGGTRHGHVVRYDTRQPFQQAGSWSVYDADGTRGLHTVGYFGCVYDGRYAYFAPHFDGTGYHGRALRYDTRAPFASANAWEAYDAGNTGGLNCKGYAGGVFDGRYVYYVPLRDGADLTNRHARMLRYDTQGAFTNGGSWTAFDAGSIGGLNTKAYSGATFDGRFVYFAPYPDVASPHGYVLRYDTQGSFASAGSWQAMDAGNTGGLSTKGYFGAVTDGRHVYFVPCNDTAFHGRILRYDAGGGRGAFELSASGQEQYGGYGGAGFGITFRASVGEQGVTLSANQVLDSNVWHHVAVTRAGAVMRLFVDGEILASAEVGTNALVNSGAPMSIGRYPGAATGFAGYVDEVRILKGCARWTNSFVGALPGEPYPDAPVISGRLTGVADGQGMDGATVRAGTHSTVTTNGGYYTLRVPYGWSGSISAERFATTIEPAMRMIEELRADAADQDFVWRHPVPVVSGVSTSEVPSGGGATVTLSGVDFRMPWYATNWSHRQVVTIDRSQVLGVLTNYPMLVRRTVPEFRSTGNGGSVGQADGGDFLFTDASGTNKLAHEIEKYDPGTGELIAWVNVPLVQTNRDTGLFVYYGNAVAANQWNAAGTWNSNYKGVFHLNDPGPINETFTGTVVDWFAGTNYSISGVFTVQ